MKKKKQLSESSSSSDSCSKCSSDCSSDDDLPLKTVSKLLPQKGSQKLPVAKVKNPTSKSGTNDENSSDDKETLSKAKEKACASRATVVKKVKSEDQSNEAVVKRGRGRPRTKVSA